MEAVAAQQQLALALGQAADHRPKLAGGLTVLDDARHVLAGGVGYRLAVSAETLRHAGLEPAVARPNAGAALHRVRVRGRSERVDVYAVDDPRELFTE